MYKNDFVEEISEFCEFGGGPFSLETDLRSINEFDSLAVMSMVAFIDENFSIQIPAKKFVAITDFNSLIAIIGNDKFEDDD